MNSHFDVLVVGAGVAGMACLLSLTSVARGLKIGLISPGEPGTLGSTPWAQGGIAAAWESGDSPDLHRADTCAAGAGLCRPEAVEVLTREGPARIEQLLELGAAFDRDAQGRLALTLEAAHQRARVIHRGDSSGRELAQTLARALSQRGGFERIQGQVVQLFTRGSRIVGVQLDDLRQFSAAQVVLATGGLGQLFPATTNPPGCDGLGLILAYQAGAHLRDLEFVQFHPTALAVGSGGSLPLMTEALRGEGGWLVDERGHRFLADFHPQAELAPRDVVAFAIWRHRQAGHQTYLDVRHLPLEERFQQVCLLCRRAGLDPTRELLPVAPAAHYHMGGIEVDLWGRSAVAGLWACGEVASTGVHGANRLASNSLLEGLVFGHRVGQALAESDFARGWLKLPEPVPTPAHDPLAWARLQEILGLGLGLARSQGALARSQAALEPILPHLPQLGPLASLMLKSASFRRESRGAHQRLDYPRTGAAWQGHTLLVPGREPCLQSLDPRTLLPLGPPAVEGLGLIEEGRL